MNWKKRGLIIVPGAYPWMVTHAQNPFAEKNDELRFKIHFAGRDRENRAHGGVAMLELTGDAVQVRIQAEPTLAPGRLGAFDDCGVMPSCVVDCGAEKWMYYTGWTKAVSVPFRFYIGLAVSNDGGLTYRRYSEAPVLGLCREEPFLTASPWVVREDGKFRMWYVSGSSWEARTDAVKHYYRIRYAESADGIGWQAGSVCIDYGPDEYALARPVVYYRNGLYTMWFSYRGGSGTYRIGYAESLDGINWKRFDDKAGIAPSLTGWDAEMVCYPSLFESGGRTFMIYNGNGYGRDGVGMAVLEKNSQTRGDAP